MSELSQSSPATLWNWLNRRAAGVLLHPTALPGDGGVGTLGHHLDDFLAILAGAEFSYWQVCPLGPTGFGDSPYQCFSSFAGNPYLIDLAPLVDLRLLSADAVAPLQRLNATHVDFGALYTEKRPLLFAAHAAWSRDRTLALPYGAFNAFRARHEHWLEGFALFSALKDHFGGAPWWNWPADARSLAAAKKSNVARVVAERAEAYAFIQYLFFGQWARVRARAAALGITIIGDTPIFAALDSADTWSRPELFQLDPKTHAPLAVAGCPPDYFSADGQLWGNPLYDWPVHAAEGYAWWLERLRANFDLCDVVRIDHFRGLEAYWSIPAGSTTARPGHWVPGPRMEFFRAIQAGLPHAKLIAEDLGLLTPEVLDLRAATGLPGMAVLQFAFGGGADNFYLPHNVAHNTVVYPGTHDNDTTRGWYESAAEKTRDHVRRYFRVSGDDISWDFVRAAYASTANLAIVPLQDLLSLGSEARFNQPGESQGNWQWRVSADQLAHLAADSSGYLSELAALYGRNRPPAAPITPHAT
ncbi:4-alpha-glucanotransferase [Horticoccus luteus]|uniref:4-alpha-glucanotransferase n=1 Tax=Horticoccus luteus TaxID=2862869 RepID=A0A8F9XIP2_9BACT|nr:4-alpha-glucanotransferase [Horticoccus luteus]QYM80605.1 4-alpha-glucanotransferase [Horticoccus luteus]